MNNRMVKRLLLFLLFIVLGFPFFQSNYLSQIYAFQEAPESAHGVMAGQPIASPDAPEPGLLFYLSGQQEFEANYAASGQNLPNYLRDIRIIQDGPFGPAIQADDSQLLSYWAPGNIYAQRGTLSFFWRSRYPVGPTEFPVFRVGYADHSSWDMVWLRIDYNGSGFDAFVTDVGLSRTRVSHFMDEFPGPDEWIHIALSWDEAEGIRFYVNGEPAGRQTTVGNVYDTGLDQFGPHSRIISPYQVQSAYNYQRGGDIAELRIYDRALSDENIAELTRGESSLVIPELNRDLTERKWRDAWWTRHGWNLPNEAPPALESDHTTFRKIGIHDAIDIKRWYWKANDGIRETTWPGVYNMSRLPGRFDYLIIPDWDTYSMGGQMVKFHLPENEPWNHVEMWGTAWGQLTHESEHPYEHTFAVRSKRQVKSYHRLDEPKQGGIIRFDNALIEEPIGSFTVYNVEEGLAPQNRRSETFTLAGAPSTLTNSALQGVSNFVQGRYPSDERAMMVGVPQGGAASGTAAELPAYTQPFIHIAIPYSGETDSGLDGVEIEIPGLDVTPTHGEFFPLNLRIKDPLWLMRDLADISFSVKPGEAHTVYIDTRDRMLPEGRALYLTLAGAGSELTPELLVGSTVRLIYKAKEEALAEHIKDRFTQVRDLHAHNVEENPRTPRLNSYNRFYADISDLLKHNPDHWLGQAYYYWVYRDKDDRPVYEITPAPDGVPEWAYLQIEHIRQLERIADYYIDNRQISNGEFGGGLNDDGKFTFFFTPLAYFGAQPKKILESMLLHMKAYYDQDRDPYDAPLKQKTLPFISNGLSTIQSDELHNYEEGIQVIGQLQLLDYGTPLHINRAMEVSKSLFDDVTQISTDGHRRFRSRYYGGNRIAKEDPWQWSVANSYIVLHPAFLVARHNGNPMIQQMVTELADAMLENATEDGVYPEMHFETGDVRGSAGTGSAWMVFQAAYDYTGDDKYLEPVQDYIETNREFNPETLADLYREQVIDMGVREYISTEGSIWIDRVPIRSTGWLQQHRLGGIAVERAQYSYPFHRVSWEFHEPATYESLAVFIPRGNRENIDIIAFNLEEHTVDADMTVWEIDPGTWRVRQGVDTTGDQQIDRSENEHIVKLERGSKLSLSYEPREHTIIHLELVEPAATGYWERADLGIGRDDVQISETEVTVRVHSLGASGTPETRLELRDANGHLAASQIVPEMEAPVDLIPRWIDVKLNIKPGTDLSSGIVVVDPEEKINQITRLNTSVRW
jgi:hypothetical protein